MVVLVLWACLSGQPASCTSVNLAEHFPHDECVAFADAEAREFEERHPGWQVSRSWCLRLGGIET